MKEATITTKGLVYAVRKVTKQKRVYDQENWCGTRRCIAGHAVKGITKGMLEDRASPIACYDVELALARWANKSAGGELKKAKQDLFNTLSDHRARLPKIKKQLAEVVRLERQQARKAKKK